ncbi:hypothetical protein ACWDRB_55105 [Nonomuraea sp. NPDC003707]
MPVRRAQRPRPGDRFLNGGGSGGALSLRYDNCGWFDTGVSAYTHLIVRIKGATGGK